MSDQLNFVDCLRLVKGGLATWKEKPHNAKWWKRIDGTPIPNDLCVCIAGAFVAEAALRAETPTGNELPDSALRAALQSVVDMLAGRTVTRKQGEMIEAIRAELTPLREGKKCDIYGYVEDDSDPREA